MNFRKIFFIISLFFPISANSFEFVSIEDAEIVDMAESTGNYDLPRGQYTPSDQPHETVYVQVERMAWKLAQRDEAQGVIDALTSAYERRGFEMVYSCLDKDCGGFDFRFAIDTAPMPGFLVDINNFIYVEMQNDDERLLLLSSAVNGDGYFQQSHLQTVDPDNLTIKNAEIIPAETEPELAQSRTILDSVIFEQSSAQIASYDENQLVTIAQALENDPNLSLYIVGHTDSLGGMDANLRISKARAVSVQELFIDRFDVDPNRIETDGVGFLAPIASNDTEAGQARNRRVEALLLNNAQ